MKTCREDTFHCRHIVAISCCRECLDCKFIEKCHFERMTFSTDVECYEISPFSLVPVFFTLRMRGSSKIGQLCLEL
jgi:hypothetical protein